MMNEEEAGKARASLHKMVDDADAKMVSDIISALHMGKTIDEMVESVGVATEKMPAMGVDPEEHAAVAMAMVTHKAIGDTFCITVRRASAQEVKEYARQSENARDLSKI